jgi:hypothetical protein
VASGKPLAEDGDGSQDGVSILTLRPHSPVKTVPGNTLVKRKKRGFYDLSARESDLLSDAHLWV